MRGGYRPQPTLAPVEVADRPLNAAEAAVAIRVRAARDYLLDLILLGKINARQVERAHDCIADWVQNHPDLSLMARIRIIGPSRN